MFFLFFQNQPVARTQVISRATGHGYCHGDRHGHGHDHSHGDDHGHGHGHTHGDGHGYCHGEGRGYADRHGDGHGHGHGHAGRRLSGKSGTYENFGDVESVFEIRKYHDIQEAGSTYIFVS